MNTSLKVLADRKSTEDFIELLDFLRHALIFLDFSVVGGRIMKLLVALCEAASVSDDIHSDSIATAHLSKHTVPTINAILATVLAMLEHDAAAAKRERFCSFASRVLASLAQQQPTLIYRHGAADSEVLSSGRAIFGQVMLSSSQHLLHGNGEERKTAMMLLPLSIRHIVSLSKPLDTEDDDSVAFTLFPELSILFRQLEDNKRSAPQVHEKCVRDCLVAMEVVLQPSFEIIWGLSLKPLVLLLLQMDSHGEHVCRCMKRLVVLGAEMSQDGTHRIDVNGAISYLVQGCGLEILWKQIGLSEACHVIHEDEEKNAVAQNVLWLLQLMKSSETGRGETNLSLSFFQQTVLPLARFYDSQTAEGAGKSLKRKRTVVALWALFPSFCRCPTDLESVFPGLAPLLVRAMNDERYPELVAIISSGLKTLATGVRERKLGNGELVDGEEVSRLRREADLLEVVSEKLIPSLFKLVENIHAKEKGDVEQMEVEGSEERYVDKSHKVRSLTDAIASLSQLGPQHLIQRLFSKIVQRLLEASQADEDLSEQMCMLLTLAQSLVVSESLEHSSISLLFRCLKPLIRSDETKPRVQKRAYKVLAEICQRRVDFVRKSEQLNDTYQLLTSSLQTW
ncbi:unnamed protein product [Cylindrotheca closterium]|uniref:RRP12 HEAT domain-containing protein n=1 Tax=Cylindrotheca closterium TaxID=2856 RepID=A0AAD2FMC4_9STRA|nr:unnamed protein product [Cylindrotheca closterium]